jgi:hypothetical protein
MEMTPIESPRPRASSSPIGFDLSINRPSSAPIPLELQREITKVAIICDQVKCFLNGYSYTFIYSEKKITADKFHAIVGRCIKIDTKKSELFLREDGKFDHRIINQSVLIDVTANMTINCGDDGKITVNRSFSPITY